jgi:hypothetical protein
MCTQNLRFDYGELNKTGIRTLTMFRPSIYSRKSSQFASTYIADQHKVMGAPSYSWLDISLHKQIFRNHQYEGCSQRHAAVVK